MEEDLSINWSFVVFHWRRILTGALVGFAIAGLAFMLVTPRWEASALIQIGQIGGSALSGAAVPMESIDAVAARMTRPLFIRTALQRAGHPEELMSLLPRQYDGDGGLGVRRMGSDIVVVTLQARTQSFAKQLMEGVVGEIIEEDNQLMEGRLRYDKAVLFAVQSELERRGNGAAQLEKPTSRLMTEADERTIGALTMQELFRDNLTSHYRQMALTITDELFEPNTHPTRMIGEIEVLDRPVFPRPLIFLALGVMLALAIASGLLWQAKVNGG